MHTSDFVVLLESRKVGWETVRDRLRDVTVQKKEVKAAEHKIEELNMLIRIVEERRDKEMDAITPDMNSESPEESEM